MIKKTRILIKYPIFLWITRIESIAPFDASGLVLSATNAFFIGTIQNEYLAIT
jgi:hypothetical protein